MGRLCLLAADDLAHFVPYAEPAVKQSRQVCEGTVGTGRAPAGKRPGDFAWRATSANPGSPRSSDAPKRGALTLRAAEPRDVEQTWRKVGQLLNLFSSEECANYLTNSGYVSV